MASRQAYHCTPSTKEADVVRRWFVVDATDQTLGRMSTQIASILRGKHRPDYTPHVDGGDFVVVVNAEKVKLSGRKLDQKIYYRHSGYTGGIKQQTAREVLNGPHADRVVFNAVRGMLPKTTLGRKMIKKLKVYAGPNHPHAAQRPEELNLG